jgi:TDG/mug DNA glycosylase family protein
LSERDEYFDIYSTPDETGSHTAARPYGMIEYKISNDPKILFVGINPHPGSHRRGVPFSNNKMFWYLLNRAGLLTEQESDLKNDESLKRIYDNKFAPEYGLNFVNLVDRPTVEVTELIAGEEQAGVRRALKIIRTRQPKVACFIGKVTFNKFYGRRECHFGWQPGIQKTRVYLMHFPIRGLASIRVKELKEVKLAAELGALDSKPELTTGNARYGKAVSSDRQFVNYHES